MNIQELNERLDYLQTLADRCDYRIKELCELESDKNQFHRYYNPYDIEDREFIRDKYSDTDDVLVYAIAEFTDVHAKLERDLCSEGMPMLRAHKIAIDGNEHLLE